jgi:hypothetical protein
VFLLFFFTFPWKYTKRNTDAYSAWKTSHKVKKRRIFFRTRGCMTHDPRILFHTKHPRTLTYILPSSFGYPGLNLVPETLTVSWFFSVTSENIGHLLSQCVPHAQLQWCITNKSQNFYPKFYHLTQGLAYTCSDIILTTSWMHWGKRRTPDPPKRQ